MQSKAYKVTTVISCLLVVFAMFKISNLNDRINSLERQLNNMESRLFSQLNAVSSGVDQKLEEYTNFLADFSWNFCGSDIDNRTVDVLLSVTPKENYPNETLAEIFLDGVGYPMRGNNGIYETIVTLPLFDDALVEKVVFSEENRTRTEKLNWGISPKYDFLPVITAQYRGSTHSTQNGTLGVDQITAGTIEIDFDLYNKCFVLKSAELVETLNGKELERTSLILSETNPDSPNTADAGKNHRTWQEEAANGTCDYLVLYSSINREYNIPNGGHHEMFVEITDSHGFIYRCKIESTLIGDNGSFVDDDPWHWWGCEADILSPNREVLFKTEYM